MTSTECLVFQANYAGVVSSGLIKIVIVPTFEAGKTFQEKPRLLWPKMLNGPPRLHSYAAAGVYTPAVDRKDCTDLAVVRIGKANSF